jgi:hypothetical protein
MDSALQTIPRARRISCGQMLHDVGSTIGVVKFMESATNWEVDPEIEPLWAYVYYEHLEVTSDSHSLHMASCMLFGLIHHFGTVPSYLIVGKMFKRLRYARKVACHE